MAPSLLHACFSGFGDPPLTCRRQRCYFCILLWELVVSACLCCGIASSDVHICHDRVRLGRGTSTSHQLDGIALHKISQGYRQLVMNSGTGSCSIRNICDLGESRRCYVRLEYVNASSQMPSTRTCFGPFLGHSPRNPQSQWAGVYRPHHMPTTSCHYPWERLFGLAMGCLWATKD